MPEKNWGKAFEGAIAGAKVGTDIVMDYYKLKSDTQQQNEFLKQRADQLQMQRDDQNEQKRQFAIGQFDKHIFNYYTLAKDPESAAAAASYWELNLGNMAALAAAGGYKGFDEQRLRGQSEAFGPVLAGYAATSKNVAQQMLTGKPVTLDQVQLDSIEKTNVLFPGFADNLTKTIDNYHARINDDDIRKQQIALGRRNVAVDEARLARENAPSNIIAKGSTTPVPNYQVPQLAQMGMGAVGEATPEGKITVAPDTKDDDFKVARAADKYKQEIYTNPIVRKVMDAEVSSAILMDMIQLAKDGNEIAASSMGAKAAKAMGEVGVLTETDINRYVTRGAITSKLADKLRKTIKGKPTDFALDEMTQLHQVLSDRYQAKMQPIINRQLDTFATNWLGASKKGDSTAWNAAISKAEEMIGFSYGRGSTGQPESGVSDDVINNLAEKYGAPKRRK